MKPQYKLTTCLGILLVSIYSCSKPVIPPTPNPNSTVWYPPIPNKEFFRRQSWLKTSTGYEIKLQSHNLTDTAIANGIKVGVAFYPDGLFVTLPFTINEPFDF